MSSLVAGFGKKESIVGINAWINKGTLKMGDDIMFVLVAGRLRTDVLLTFEGLLSRIKKEVVPEEVFS